MSRNPPLIDIIQFGIMVYNVLMLTKMIFALIDCLAVFDLYFTIKAMKQIKENHGLQLRRAMSIAIVAIFANILIAFSFNPAFAKIAYSAYFASIDWIIFYLTAFCLGYTEHDTVLQKLRIPAYIVMAADSASILANLFFGHVFYIYETTDISGTVFYQTGFLFPYYIHLAVDYVALMIAFVSIVYRIYRTYGMYRTKYVMILGVLLFVVALNVVYMAFSLLLDSSVVFYAVAGTLIYFSITKFIPRSIMVVSMRTAIDDIKEGLILFDIGDNCIYANAFSKQRFDIEEDRYDMSCEPVASVLSALSEKGEKYGESRYLKTTNNGDEHYMIRYNSLTDKKGRLIGSYFLIEDTTEADKYLNELEEARRNADAANRAKSTFLANMSHEIRTPLNSVLGLNEMILRTSEDQQILEYADSIRSSGDTLLGLINDILDFSKIEANRMEFTCAAYSLHKLLKGIINNFTQMAEEKGLYIKAECDPSIPSVLVGDEKLIRQIITNLVSNAVKYTQKGGITIRARSDAKEGGCDLLIDVADTGIGVAHEDEDILFDPFKRINEKENATIQGTGLGLAITKDLISLMNGSITITSALGEGSTFSLILPQDVEDPTPAGEFKLHDDPGKRDKYKESFHAPNAHILIVDDSKMNLKVATALLKNTQVAVDTALGGNEAITLCKSAKYDVILLDHRMPEPDGIETFKIISKQGLNTDTPVIMLTANAISGAEEEYIDLGFAGYLSKPIRPAQLEKELIRLLPKEKVVKNI